MNWVEPYPSRFTSFGFFVVCFFQDTLFNLNKLYKLWVVHNYYQSITMQKLMCDCMLKFEIFGKSGVSNCIFKILIIQLKAILLFHILQLKIETNMMQNQNHNVGLSKPLAEIKKRYDSVFEKSQNDQFGQQIDRMGQLLAGFNDILQKKMQSLQIKLGVNKQAPIDHSYENQEGEQRFIQMKFDFKIVNQKSRQERLLQIKRYSADIARKIVTRAFVWLEQGKISEQKLRQFFCNNFIANIVRFADANDLNNEELQQLDSHLKENVFSFLKRRYPMNQSGQANRKFDSLINPVDNLESNENDLVEKSGVKFVYKENQDYSKQIMQFINYLITLTRQDRIEPDGSKSLSLTKQFFKDMQQIFQKVQNEDWTIKAAGPNPNFLQVQSQKKPSTALGPQQKLRIQAMKQKYKKSVKQYTKYLIGQKISPNFNKFTDKQISQQNLSVSNSTVMRILTKWCEELQKCFQEININSRDERFRMENGSERYIKKQQRRQLYIEIMAEDENRKEFLKKVMSNIYQNQYKMLMDKKKQCLNAFRDFASEDEGITGYFATVMKKSYENYLISYLNKLIHCILSAQKKFKQKYPRKDHYKISVNLISFKVGDLLRCKCSSKQTQIIALYKYLDWFTKNNKKDLEMVRVKNRLSEGTKDILINLKYKQKLLVEMQLSINSETSNFIKCSDKTNHFIYELERATFGPILEICNSYSVVDPRSEFFTKKFQALNDKKLYKTAVKNGAIDKCTHIEQQDDKEKKKLSSLPIWCDICKKFTASLNLVVKHRKCGSCVIKNRCAACLIRNKQCKQYSSFSQVDIDKDYQLIKVQKQKQSFIKKKYKVLDLEKKNKSQCNIYVVYFNFKVLFFQELTEGKRGLVYIGQANNSKQWKRFFANKEILEEYDLAKFTDIKQITKFVHSQIIKIMMKNVKKKLRKYFVWEEVQLQSIGEQSMQTVQNININNAKVESIKNLVNNFPKAKIIFVHKNNIMSLDDVHKWKYAKQLNLQGNQLQQIPQEINQLENLQFLLLTNNDFTSFPKQICEIKNLKILNFKQNKVQRICPQIGHLVSLKNLRLAENKIKQIPVEIQKLVNLVEFDLGKNQLTALPDQMSKLTKLQLLLIQQNKIQEISQNFFQKMQQLKRVQVSGNRIKKIPVSLSSKPHLSRIQFQKNQLTTVPQFIFQLPNLEQLQLSQNQINQIVLTKQPKCEKLKVLFLDKNRLAQLPEKIFEIKGLSKLKISDNPFNNVDHQMNGILKFKQLNLLQAESLKLVKIPSQVFKMQKLTALSFDKNQITQISPEISNLSKTLQQFYISDNKLNGIPKALFTLQKLQNLGLNNNNISEIPVELCALEKLEKLKVESNPIKEIPKKILQLKYLFEIYITIGNLTVKDIQIPKEKGKKKIQIIDSVVKKEEEKKKKEEKKLKEQQWKKSKNQRKQKLKKKESLNVNANNAS